MAVGNPQGLTDWNYRAGGLAVQLREVMHQIEVFKSELDTVTDGTLTAMGMTSGDVAVLRSAYADAADLAGVFAGAASSHLTGTYDYRQFVKLLYGVQ